MRFCVSDTGRPSVGVFQDVDIGSEFLDNGVSHIGVVRTRIADGIATGYARGEGDDVRAPVNHGSGSFDGSFSRTAATTDESHNFHGSAVGKRQFSLGCDFEIGCSRTNVLRLLAAYDSDFFHYISSLWFILWLVGPRIEGSVSGCMAGLPHERFDSHTGGNGNCRRVLPQMIRPCDLVRVRLFGAGLFRRLLAS